jgi:hypothetical protein
VATEIESEVLFLDDPEKTQRSKDRLVVIQREDPGRSTWHGAAWLGTGQVQTAVQVLREVLARRSFLAVNTEPRGLALSARARLSKPTFFQAQDLRP